VTSGAIASNSAAPMPRPEIDARGEGEETGALLRAYLERRGDLRRFFLARLGGDADVEDLVQELYLKVVDLDGRAVRNPASFLYSMASSLMLDRMRQSRRAGVRDFVWRSTTQTFVGSVEIADGPDAEATVIARQRLERLNTALQALSPKTQSVFRAHKFEGLSYVETAKRLGMSRKAVEKHMGLALGHLLARVGR
jgi:RNA polymerase sigma factor (sigma-70 family)